MMFEGKKIMIVGASSGIGRETALYLDSLGAETVIVARREEELKKLSEEMSHNCSFIPYDLQELENIESI